MLELMKRGGLAGVAAVLMVVAGAGMASATPADPVADAFADAQAKVTQYGGLLVGVAVAAVLILFGIAWIRKIRSN